MRQRGVGRLGWYRDGRREASSATSGLSAIRATVPFFPERGRHSALGLPPSTRAQSLRTTVRADVREYRLRRPYCERGCSGDRSPPEWSSQDAPHPCTGESGSFRHARISSYLGRLHGHACRTLRLCLAAHAEVSRRCGVRKQSVPRLGHLHTRTRDPRTSPCLRATDERVEI